MKRLVIMRLLTLVGLVVCTGLLVEELAPEGALCGREGGCAEVLHSGWARPLGVPLPVAGLGFFACLLGLSLAQGQQFLLLRVVAAAGGTAALGFILVQALVLGHFCPFCVGVDGIAMCVALLVLVRTVPSPPPSIPSPPPSIPSPPNPLSHLGERGSQTGERGSQTPLAPPSPSLGEGGWGGEGKPAIVPWVVAGVLSVVVGMAGWGIMRLHAAGKPPPFIVRLRHPDRVTIVEIIDFHCKYCRAMHRSLNRVEAESGVLVHRVCLADPKHEPSQSRTAARALWCARQQGRERAMADALFAVGNTKADSCRALAKQLGLSLPAFESCLVEPAGDSEWTAELAAARAASPKGLPTIWIDDERLDGMQPLGVLQEAIRRAERKRTESAP